MYMNWSALLWMAISRLPWFVIAGIAVLAYFRDRKLATLLQAIGGAILALLLFFDVAFWLLTKFASVPISTFEIKSCGEMLIALIGYALFASGYGMEKLGKPGAK